MRLFITASLLVFSFNGFSQIVPSAGPYTTSDGYYTINVSLSGTTLEVVEPNKKSAYTLVSGNEYKFVNPTNGIEYRIEVVSETEIASFKPNSRNNRTQLFFSGTLNEAPVKKAFDKYKVIAEKYQGWMKTDSKDAQLWAFCAAAAIARSSFNDEGFEDYISKIVPSLKQIVTDKDKCPCEDAIPVTYWRRY